MGRRGLAGLIVAAAVLAALAPGAAAQPIVVEGVGAHAVIERSPLRISFQDEHGRTVLRQARGEGPLAVPPVPEPQPGGADLLDAPALYAPFPFLVGARSSVEIPATQWVGNLLTGVEGGVAHSARDVLAVERAGDGVRLTVSTTDPSRRLLVEVAPGAPGTMRVSAKVTPDDGVVTLGDAFVSRAGEAFRGFGGRHNALDQRGEDFVNWVAQQNVGAGPLEPIVAALPGTGGDRYMFPNGPHGAFHVQSQFISSSGYGFLLDRDELSSWRMASDRDDAWQVSAAAPAVDYLVAPGEPSEAIGSLTAVGGRHRVPPSWALGPQLDRLTRFGTETEASYKASVEQDLRDIERFDLPLSAYRIEAWRYYEPAQLERVIDRLHARGIRALLYFRAFVGTDEIGTDDPAEFDEALSKRYVATTPGGLPYVFIGNFFGPTALIDFTDPAARRWWTRRVQAALDLGADGFMQDFGEQVLSGMRFHDGSTGAEMHNRYPVLFHRITREAVEEWEAEHPGRDVWFFTRAGYSGTPGSAAHEGGNFPGDETTDWSRSSGLASLATDMLNRAVGGAYGYGTDIGGYFDFHTPPTTKELFIRWAEWAVLSPLMRLHGSINAGTHTPWSFDAQTVAIYNRLSRLRLEAAPYIEEAWREAAATGVPPTRPLWLAFPGDPEAARQDQQWMLGDDVLVAPVVEEGARSRRVYFPAGCWEHPETGERFEGTGYARVAAPLGRLPYFFACGETPF
ncbi:MAG: TIM-barrel domain-containing protein [Thermoleophilaceae bacterium]